MSRRGVAFAAATALVLLASSCTLFEQDSAEDDARAFAAALAKGELGAVALTRQQPAQAQRWWDRTREGMGESQLDVEVKTVEEQDDDRARATLSHTWRLEGSSAEWSYETTVALVRRNDAWAVDLLPGTVAPGLQDDELLDLISVSAPRADIIGAGGKPLVTERPVLRFGIDKTLVRPQSEADSARTLAQLLDVDAADFVARVEAAGDKAFVEALVLREQDVTAEMADAQGSVPGVRAIPDELPLAPTREFARPLLGTVGSVTAEMIEKSGGEYDAGDVAGLSGLQQRYDEQLRGEPGVVVRAVDARTERERTLFRTEPRAGKPLRLSLDVTMQLRAEQYLDDVSPASALVALRPSTGDLLAVASGPGSGGYSTATLGQYAPGSTFKVVTSLALLRSGLSMDARLSCPATTVVDGKEFENYSDYPGGSLGEISLREAVAQSCNTAFVSQHERITEEELREAAAALGLGEDHDVGFPAYFGSVPPGGSTTDHAASLIGQGRILASPMAMAAVAGSVSAGRTVVPRLLGETEATASPSTPLTAQEAERLRQLMTGVVEGGSGQFLADVPGRQVLAKTGTAEFGDQNPPQTHAWMIASQGDLAVAVFVEVGESGSRTAGPILEEFLRAVG